MIFASTRNPQEQATFSQAVLKGLAPDGGLYAPLTFPHLQDFFQGLSPEVSIQDVASGLISALLGDEFSPEEAQSIAQEAFPFSPVLVEAAPGIRVLELFHGPSCAFKDFGASFLATVMNRLLAKEGRRAIIVTATSGDTGSAVAQAFYGKECIDVVILYPSGRVSPLQEKQLTTLGGNVTALEVKGNFDDCQRMAKAAFTNPELTSLPLSSANSISLGRLVPQSFYYIWADARLRDFRPYSFVVPSGNFGNLTAGLYAASWGMNTPGFVAATNANDVVPEFLSKGIYSPRPSVATYSNAMDVGAPSNFERLQALFHHDVDQFRNALSAYTVCDETTAQTMDRVFQNHGYLCCPHTAVGWKAAELFREKHPDQETVVLSTAHPGKFVEVVEQITGTSPSLPEELSCLLQREKISVKVGNTDADLAQWLLEQFA